VDDSLRQLRLCGALLVALMAAGTVGFWVTGPDRGPAEAFYLTLVVLTTVGMEAAEGPQRGVATVLMVGGIFTTLYAAGTLVAFVYGSDPISTVA